MFWLLQVLGRKRGDRPQMQPRKPRRWAKALPTHEESKTCRYLVVMTVVRTVMIVWIRLNLSEIVKDIGIGSISHLSCLWLVSLARSFVAEIIWAHSTMYSRSRRSKKLKKDPNQPPVNLTLLKRASLVQLRKIVWPSAASKVPRF